MKTGEIIKFLRISKGLSQEQLGQAIGVKKSAICKYEKGRVENIKRTTLIKLAEALGVRPIDLINDDFFPDLAIEVTDHKMTPTFDIGDVVYVHAQNRFTKDGIYYVQVENDSLILARIQKQNDGVLLRFDNETYDRQQVFTADDIASGRLEIIGIAVKYERNL